MNTKCWARFRYKQRLQFHPIRIFCLIWIHHFIRNEETQTRTTRAPIIWDVILHSGRAAEQAMLSYIYSQSPMAIAHRQKIKKKHHKKYECIKYRRLYHLPRALNSFSTPFTTLFCLPKIVTQRIWLLQHFLFCFVVYFLFSSLLFSFHKHGATTNGITDKE